MNDDMMMVVVVNGEKNTRLLLHEHCCASNCVAYSSIFLHFEWKVYVLCLCLVVATLFSQTYADIGTSFCKWKRAWHRNTPGRIPTP